MIPIILLLLPRIEKSLYNIDCGPVDGYFLISFFWSLSANLLYSGFQQKRVKQQAMPSRRFIKKQDVENSRFE